MAQHDQVGSLTCTYIQTLKKAKLLMSAGKSKKPERRSAEVGTWRELCHYILVSTSNQRDKITDDNSFWRMVRTYNWGTAVSTAAETILMTDVIVLLAIVKYAQDHPEKVTETELIKGSKYVLQISMSKTELYSYVGNRDWRQIIGDQGDAELGIRPSFGSVMRLLTWKVQYWETGKSLPRTQQFLYDYDFDKSIFAISKDFYEICVNGENIDFELLKKINSRTAQALYLYLRGNRMNRKPLLKTLKNALGLKVETKANRYDAKNLIIEAFERLRKFGILQPDSVAGFYDARREQYHWKADWNFFGGRTLENYSEKSASV